MSLLNWRLWFIHTVLGCVESWPCLFVFEAESHMPRLASNLLHSWGWPWVPYLPASSTECENYKRAPPCPVCIVLGIKLKAPCMLDQCSVREHSPPLKSWPLRNDKEKSKMSVKTWRRDVSLETACSSFLLTIALGWRSLVTKSYHLISFSMIFKSYTLRERLNFVHPECEGGPSHVSETRDGTIFLCQFSLLISWKTLSFWLWLSGVKSRSSPCEVVSWFLFRT